MTLFGHCALCCKATMIGKDDQFIDSWNRNSTSTAHDQFHIFTWYWYIHLRWFLWWEISQPLLYSGKYLFRSVQLTPTNYEKVIVMEFRSFSVMSREKDTLIISLSNKIIMMVNIATGETSQAITPFHFFDNFNFHH